MTPQEQLARQAALQQEILRAACEFVEIATPFFDKYRALIPTSLAGYFARLRTACEDYRKETKGAP